MKIQLSKETQKQCSNVKLTINNKRKREALAKRNNLTMYYANIVPQIKNIVQKNNKYNISKKIL